MSNRDPKDPKLLSLLRLAAARQAQDFGDLAQRAYLVTLLPYPAEDVSRACLELASRERGEYEPAMPPAATIGGLCAVYERRRREDMESRRRLAPPADRPCPPEKLANLKRDVEAYAARQRMR